MSSITVILRVNAQSGLSDQMIVNKSDDALSLLLNGNSQVQENMIRIAWPVGRVELEIEVTFSRRNGALNQEILGVKVCAMPGQEIV